MSAFGKVAVLMGGVAGAWSRGPLAGCDRKGNRAPPPTTYAGATA